MYRQQLVKKFEAVVELLVFDVKNGTDGDKGAQDSFRWKLVDQLVEDPFWKLTKEVVSGQRKQDLEKRREKHENDRKEKETGKGKPSKGSSGEIDLSSVDKELKEARKLWQQF